MGFREELMEWDDDFRRAPEPDEPLPDGTYTAQLLTADIVRGKNDPALLYLKCEFGVAGGEQDGRTTSVLQALNPGEAKRMAFTKRFLRTLGYDAPSLAALEDWLPHAVGCGYEIQVKTNGQYVNVYVNRRAPLPDEASPAFPDDLPF